VIQDAPGNSGANVDVYGDHVEISKNEITNSQEQGVYTDEGSHHVQILGNRIHHNGAGVVHQSHGIYPQGDDHLVENNVIHDHPNGVSGVHVHNNVLAFISHWGISNDSSRPASSVADHNMLFGNDYGPTRGRSGLSFAGGNRTTDPLFAGYAARDFHLVPGSTALDYGLVAYSPSTDFAGVARTYGAAPDAGAPDAGAFERL
jgi:hypothetical protein